MDSSKPNNDPSNGWEPIATIFMANRDTTIGVKTLESWMKSFAHKATVLDIGCGFGRFLFTAPFQACSWKDILTGRNSQSLGKDFYMKELSTQGLFLENEYTDEGENHYFDFTKYTSAVRMA